MMKKNSSFDTTIKDKEYFNTSALGTYPKLDSYAKEDQFYLEPEDPLEFASMIVNFDDEDFCEAPKFDNLLAIIKGYKAYIIQTEN